MDIDLKLLRCVVALARHRNFNRAATALRISQPALSRRIATLERQLGLRIFERAPGAVVATPAGSEFIAMAEELVTRATALSNKLDLMRTGRAGHLRVAVGTFIADVAVNAAVVQLVGRHPSIQLELLESDGVTALNQLMMDRVDLVLRDITALQDVPGLRFESLGTLSGRYVCRAGHPLLDLETITLQDIRKYPMAFPRANQQHVAWMQDADIGLTADSASASIIPSIAVSSCRLMYEIVAASDAISVAHPSQVRKEVESNRLALFDLPWQKRGPTARFGMIRRQNRTLPPSGQLLLDAVRDVMRSL